MERRIKIVWVLSIVAMLLITCGQVYWLCNQYRYMNDEQIDKTYNSILQTTQRYDSLRAPQPKKVFNDRKVFFYNLNTYTDEKKLTTINDIVLGALKQTGYSDLGYDSAEVYKSGVRVSSKLERIEVINNDSAASNKNKKYEKGDKKTVNEIISEDRILFKDSFKIALPDKEVPNITSIVNLYKLELDVPFALQQFDSLLSLSLDRQTFETRLEIAADTVGYQWHPTLEQHGTFFHPYIEVSYPYNPLKRQLVIIKADISPHTVLISMGWQLLGSIFLILLLGLCLLFQIKTILKQRRIDELRKSFVNTMIHELKRPVQALKMCVAFINDKSLRIDEKAMDAVIHDSISELDNLSAYLSKLRDMTRADDEHTQLSVRTFSIKDTLDKLVRLYHCPDGKDVSIETHFSPETLVTADPMHISNIISNLIENAVKYSGSSVHIVVDCLLHNHQFTVRVSDNGIGIPPSEQTRVFDKFYRGSNLPDRSLPGIGLGLSYVKLLVEAHHGTISLNSQPGKGTEIEINIPQ